MGRLYSAVIERLQMPSNRIVMIEDNKPSDVDNALKVGFKTIYLENKKQHDFYFQFESDLSDSRSEFHRFLSSPEVKGRLIPFSNVKSQTFIGLLQLYINLI